ncbi:mCG147946 [Mus musculus]|nr:mCG147946 [Mus musculus]
MLRSPAGWGCEATAWAPEAASRPGVGAAGPGPHGARLGGSGGRAAPWAAGGRGACFVRAVNYLGGFSTQQPG